MIIVKQTAQKYTCLSSAQVEKRETGILLIKDSDGHDIVEKNNDALKLMGIAADVDLNAI